jgi:hypothetical protein
MGSRRAQAESLESPGRDGSLAVDSFRGSRLGIKCLACNTAARRAK